MNRVFVFDFDGTLIKKDSFIEFIKFVKGKTAFYKGFLLHAHLIIAFKIKLIPNWYAKEKIFGYFFKGMSLVDFNAYGIAFSKVIDTLTYEETLKDLKEFTKMSDGEPSVYIISASMVNWIKPWAEKMGNITVLATEPDTDRNNFLTGKFKTNNCHGKEKIYRFTSAYPVERSRYFLTSYGDSSGDTPLLNFSDKSFFIVRGRKTIYK